MTVALQGQDPREYSVERHEFYRSNGEKFKPRDRYDLPYGTEWNQCQRFHCGMWREHASSPSQEATT